MYPLAINKEQNYENFIAICPYRICGYKNVYNRCDDLETFEPIEGQNVKCFSCGKNFRINGDEVNAPYEYLYYDCDEFIKQKRYMNCIINFAQSIEMFLSHCIRVKLLWLPYQKGIITLDKVNSISENLSSKIKELHIAFHYLKNIFFDVYLNQKTFCSKCKILDYIDKLELHDSICSNLAKCRLEEPPDCDTQKYPDSELVSLFMNLKRTKVNTLRNDVVHRGYRPSIKEVKKYKKETAKVIFGLGGKLKIKWEDYYLNCDLLIERQNS